MRIENWTSLEERLLVKVIKIIGEKKTNKIINFFKRFIHVLSTTNINSSGEMVVSKPDICWT